MDDNESEDSDNGEENDSGNDESENESESETSEKEDTGVEIVEITAEIPENVTVKDFLTTPSIENFIALGDDRAQIILQEVQV